MKKEETEGAASSAFFILHSPFLLPLALGLAATMLLLHFSVMAAAPENSNRLYIGTYTGGTSRGIYLARFDSSSGEISRPDLAAETPNPTFLALSPDQRFLYAVNEIGNFGGKPSGAVSAFSIEKNSGRLKLLNQQPSGGSGPCHLALDRQGKCVLVANYGSGSVAAFHVQPDGALSAPVCQIQHHGSSVNPQRQEGPHAHFITADPENHFALACDLGLDQVLVYRFDPAKAMLTPNDAPIAALKPGSGPRHLAFHPGGRWAYGVNEMGATLSVFEYDSRRGTLHELQTISTLPADFAGEKSGAEVVVHPSGKFVYGSNRGHDSIAAFSIDANTGKVTSLGHVPTRGKTPRHFALDPSGKWLLAENQDSNDIFVFRLDPKTGGLQPVGARIQIGAPVCAVFLR